MYDQGETPTLRRGLWMVLWFIVIVAVLWVLIWLIFFRDTSPKETHLRGSNANQSQSSDKTGNGGSNNNKSNDGNGNGNGAANDGSNSTATNTSPDELANTGAGNVVVPFVVATAAGTALYYVRLRRKVLSRWLKHGLN